MTISKECIGLAAEFAVASELCKRGIYAQLTFGNKKWTGILVMTEHEIFTRIEVKAKQGATWPNCKGIYGNNIFLVLVDFANKNEDTALLKRVQIYLCHKFSGQKLKEIGLHFGIGVSGVSQASRRVALQIKDDKKLEKKIDKIISDLYLSTV